MAVDLARDVALEDAHDLRLGASVGEAAFDVGAGARIGAHAGEHDAPQSVIRLAVAAAVESMADGLAGRGVDRGDPAEVGEGASEVIRSALSPAATSSSGGGVHADAGQLEQARSGRPNEVGELTVEVVLYVPSWPRITPAGCCTL